MDDNICKCHCGTRIVVDQQLLEERETWKEKYLCLQKQATNDIGRLKQNIYAECATLMQQQFTTKEAENNRIINGKNAEVKSLTARVIHLEARVKILEKENEILKNKEKELQGEVADQQRLIQNLRSRENKGQRDWEIKLQQEVTLVRRRVTQQYQDNLQNIESQNQHLRHKVKQFQKKYQIIIPEVERLKNTLSSKNQQLEQVEAKLQKLKKDSQQQILRSKQEVDEIQKVHGKCKGTINKLSEKVEALTQDLEAASRVKREVKVEPVYIERPVEVERIVQRIVEVEKVVNKYIEPTSFRDEELQLQNAKLKEELSNLVRQVQLFDDKHRFTIQEYEESLKQHEDNTGKYKKERQSLAKTIEEQQKEIDMIHLFLEKRSVESRPSAPEKIIVHVNKDGSYQKTVQRAPVSSTASNNNVPSNTRGTRKR